MAAKHRRVYRYGILAVLATLTILRNPYFFWVNVVFWYFAAVGIRLVYLKLMNTLNKPEQSNS